MGNEAACGLHAASISFRPPPLFGGGLLIHPPLIGILSNNDGAAHNAHAAPSFNFVYPPFGGNVFNLIRIFDVSKINLNIYFKYS